MVTRDSIHRSKRHQPSRRIDPTSPTSDEDAFALSSTAIRALQAHDAPLNAPNVLHLQRTIGNRAVSRLVHERSAQRVQRTYITIEKIDYDPDEGDFIDGRIRSQFFTDVGAAIRESPAFAGAANAPFRNRVPDVLGEVQRPDEYKGADAKIVIDLLLTAFIDAYKSFGVMSWGAPNTAALRAIIENALQSNIALIPKHTLDAGERSEFDTLVSIVGKDKMSREKGKPTDIPLDSLPGNVKSAAQLVQAGIAKEKTLWPLNTRTLPYEYMSLDAIRTVVMNRLPRYQGNHSNKAGWLTDSPMPANWVDPAAKQIYDNASRALQGKLLKKDAQRRINSNSGMRAEYKNLFTAATTGKKSKDLLSMVWLAATSGISPYIEFSLSGTSISRMMYNVITGEYYVTAHYKWGDAYNPFFHLT
ncbi:MAG: hypothetical protein U0670_07435 [Anaerolineae bacterium]